MSLLEDASTTVAVGRSVPRRDGRAQVTGAVRFTRDLASPGTWHGWTVRAAVPHGRLLSVRPDPGLERDGIVVVTAAEVPGRNTILLDRDDQPALVPIGGEVRHAGEPVALVAAPTRELARRAAARIRVEVEPLAAVLTIDDALAAGQVFHELRLGHGDVDAAMASADLIVDGTYTTGPAEHVYLEPQAMLATWSGSELTVTGSMQCPYYVHRALAAALDLPAEAVIVRQAPTGGGFGGKEEYPSVVAVHAALLARACGHPVLIAYDRAEDLACTTKRHPSQVHHRLGLRADGTIAAIDVDLVLDGGAYVTLSPVVLLRACAHAAGPYRSPTVRIRGRAVHTHHHPSGAFRGFGAPQAEFAAERQMAKAARVLGIDPWELRRRNALQPGDITATAGRADGSTGMVPVLDALAARWAAPPPPPVHPRAIGPQIRRGRGMAAGFHGGGFSGAGESILRAAAAVARSARRTSDELATFEVRVSSTDIGQGAATTLAQIAATALGVPLDRVAVAPPDTSCVPNSGPTVASRTIMVVGAVVERAATRLRERLAGSEGGGLDEVVERATYEPPPDAHWDEGAAIGEAYASFGWAATAVEVAIDTDTWEVTVERCVQAVDCGTAINPLIVRGQIEGGTLQGLGWALTERCVRSDGVVRTADLATYVVPTALDAPEIEAVVVEVPFPHGPSGAKGIGELPLDTPAAAVANAIEDTLGIAVDEVPMLPDVLHRLAIGAGGGGGRP